MRGDELDDEARLNELIEVVIGIASNRFDKRAHTGDGTRVIDGLAAGINMLAEEVGKARDRDEWNRRRLLQRERLLAVGQLAAGVAHEINNPATFVLTNLVLVEGHLNRLGEMIERTWDGDERAEAMALIDDMRDATRDDLRGVERVVTIARQLRSFSRLEPDQVESLRLGDVVADACKLVRAEILYRARLEVSLPSTTCVRGERTKLEQVFTNLLLNAVQAIPEGTPHRHTVSVVETIRGVEAVVTIRDTGTGMSDDAQARLFEPFFTTKPRDLGTGLGLPISADIVRHHGGRLRLVETSSAGTTFEVVLPLDGAPVAAAPRSERQPQPGQGKARVLIVDDDAALLDAYRRFYRAEFEMTLCTACGEAIRLMEGGEEWDAILCDLMMPDLDGLALHEWCSAHRPDLIPRMVFCSGGAFTPRSLAFAERLGDRLLRKPLRPVELRAAVTSVVGR